jgi:hypothetical protein
MHRAVTRAVTTRPRSIAQFRGPSIQPSPRREVRVQSPQYYPDPSPQIDAPASSRDVEVVQTEYVVDKSTNKRVRKGRKKPKIRSEVVVGRSWINPTSGEDGPVEKIRRIQDSQQVDLQWSHQFVVTPSAVPLPIYCLNGLREFPLNQLTLHQYTTNYYRLGQEPYRTQLRCVLRLMMNNLYDTISMFNTMANRDSLPTFAYRSAMPRYYSVGDFDAYVKAIGVVTHKSNVRLHPFCVRENLATPSVIQTWAEEGGTPAINPWCVLDRRRPDNVGPLDLDDDDVESWDWYNVNRMDNLEFVQSQASLFLRDLMGSVLNVYSPRVDQPGASYLHITTRRDVPDNPYATAEIRVWSMLEFNNDEAQLAARFGYGQLPHDTDHDGHLRPIWSGSLFRATSDQASALLPQLERMMRN